MRYYKYVFLSIVFCNMSAFSQEKNIQHSIEKGETISAIAKYYNIKPSEIYELNPEARNGIKYKGILIIPAKAKNNLTASITGIKTTTYEVQPKETLYGISKQYNTTVEDLYKINPDLEKEGLKIGQTINVPQTGSNLVSITKSEKPNISQNTPKQEAIFTPKIEEKAAIAIEGITYEVLPKESLYSIAKQHGITLADLQKANPELENKTLRVGQKIIVPGKANVISTPVIVQKQNSVEPKIVTSPTIMEEKKLETEITREVLPKETKYGIAKEYGLTVSELEKQNPGIVKKLIVGSVLKIRSPKTIDTKIIDQSVAVKEETDKKDTSDVNHKLYDVAFVDKLISTASENIGTRYRSGGTTKDGFDCSGLMYFTFNNYDIKLPRSSFEMAGYGSRIESDSAKKGDLIFFKTNGRGRINHVGMVTEVLDGEIKFIHSSTSSGVIISSTKESYYEKNFAQVNRIF